MIESPAQWARVHELVPVIQWVLTNSVLLLSVPSFLLFTFQLATALLMRLFLLAVSEDLGGQAGAEAVWRGVQARQCV